MTNEAKNPNHENSRIFSGDPICKTESWREEFRLWGQIAACFLALIFLSPLTIKIAVGQTAIDVSIEIASEAQPAVAEESTAVEEEVADAAPQVRAEVESDDAAALAKTSEVLATSDVDAAPTKDSAEVHPLSVEPSRQLLPRDRPEWISAQPDYQSDVHQFVVASIPTSDQSEVEASLDAAVVEHVDAYLRELFSQASGAGVDLEQLPSEFIRTNSIDDSKSYLTPIETAAGPLYQKWVMVQVTPEQRAYLRGWYGQQIQRKRLVPLGIGLITLLTCIGLSSLFLKRHSGQSNEVSPVAQAKHRRRCQFFPGKFAVVAAVVITILVAGRLSSLGNHKPSPSRTSHTRSVGGNAIHQVQRRIEHQSDHLSRKQKMAMERVKHQVERSVQRVKQRLDHVKSCCPD